VLDAEQIIDSLILALHETGRLLANRSLALHASAEWSEVTTEVEPWTSGFSGYLDGELAGFGGVAWRFELARDESGWIVERSLDVNRNDGVGHQETYASLPDVQFESSYALAKSLPTLIAELLAIPEPTTDTNPPLAS
jgi:hypothetical protein